MVTAIEFAVRDIAGGSQRGNVAGEGQGNFIQVGSGDSVSLNLARSSVVGYEQSGGDLIVKLADGRNIVLSGYFNEAPGDVNHLYLSDADTITEVIVSETGDGMLYADYGPLQGWEKWSPLDDLRFAQADGAAGTVGASDEPAGMAGLFPGLMGGAGGLGLAGALLGGVAVVGGGGGGGGSTPTRVPPTVDPQTAAPLTTNTTNPAITVTGTGQPGEAVSVVVGGVTQTTTITPAGTWSVTYPTTGLPGDGNHTALVTVTQPNGTVTNLTGPAFVIDMTPPAVDTTFGTVLQNDVENLSEYANGVSLGGTGEVGAKISVVINGHTQLTTVGTDGKWTVTFTQAQIPGGDLHTLPAVITATDALGNTTVLNQSISIDTVPYPITVTSVGGADNVVNLNESGSFAVTGTSTPGISLNVTIGGVTQPVVVGADGTWTANFGRSSIPTDGNATVTVSAMDAAGNASSVPFQFRVDTAASLAVNQVAGNDIVNMVENGNSIAVSGTSEPGSTNVMVTWNGTTLPATVDATSGNWTVNFAANLFGSIQSTQTQITVTAMDSVGNAASSSRNVTVDTLAEVAMGSGQIGGDDRLVASETSGFNLTGTADANASVAVTFEGQTVTVLADGNGNWSAPFFFGSSATTRTSTVQVTATDGAGNTASTTHLINIDTEVQNFKLTAVDDLSSLAAGADAVNAAEALNGVTISGTVEPGSTVTVMWGSSTLPASAVTVNAQGLWTAVVPASLVPADPTTVMVTATARDMYGNLSAPQTQNVMIDRVVEPLSRSGGQLGGDGYINAEEAAAGMTLTGTVEAGSTVNVSLNGGAGLAATVTGNTWTITVPKSSLPEGSVQVQVSATDWVGNTRALATETVNVDTLVPGAAVILKDTGEGSILSGVITEGHDNNFSYHSVGASGAAVQLIAQGDPSDEVYNVKVSGVNAQQAYFPNDIPDGSYLVIRNEDAAGNEAATLYIRDTEAVNVELGRTGLQGFDFGTIDLSSADANLTITEDNILALTGANKQLTVVGGLDDVVNIAGAVEVTSGVPTGFKLYNLGSSGASVLIEDDIAVNTGV